MFGIGLQGQNCIRKIMFDSDDGYGGLWPTGFHFEMFNTLSSPTRLSLTIKMSTLRLLQFYKHNTMKYLHGFARATMDDLLNEHGSCQRHKDLSTTLPRHLLIRRNNTWKGLLDQLTSPCPNDCEMHVDRPTAHTQSTVHLSLIQACFYCEQELKLH